MKHFMLKFNSGLFVTQTGEVPTLLWSLRILLESIIDHMQLTITTINITLERKSNVLAHT